MLRPTLHLGLTSLLLLVPYLSLSAWQADTVPADTVITLERTACFGVCPDYSVTIDATGSLTYDGRSHVRVTGRQRARVPIARVAALLDTAERLAFFKQDDHYRSIRNADGTEMIVSDLPTAYVTITTRGRTKRVEDYLGAPAALRELERQIDDAAQTRRWVRIDEDTLQQLVREGRPPTAEELFQFMLKALQYDDIGVVRALIGLGVDPPKPFRGTSSSLLTWVGSAAAARALLAAGADPGGKDEYGSTPLGMAAHRPPEITAALLEAGARADEGSDSNEWTPLIAAACEGNAGVVRLLLNAGASATRRATSGESALDCARRGKRSQELSRPAPLELAPPFAIDYESVIALLERALATGKP